MTAVLTSLHSRRLASDGHDQGEARAVDPTFRYNDLLSFSTYPTDFVSSYDFHSFDSAKFAVEFTELRVSRLEECM